MKGIIGIIRYIFKLILTKINPNAYVKRLGVNLGDNIKLYGMKPYMFSTEP